MSISTGTAEELETLRGVSRMLILRILEANSVRELLDESKFKETKKEMPDILDNLMMSYTQNKMRFQTQSVAPIKVTDVPKVQEILSNCDAVEIVRLAEVTRFIMENEVHKIIGAIIDKQN
jgi:hypothetical protein